VGGLVRLLPLGRGLALPLAARPAGHAHPLGRVRRLLEYLIRRVVAVPAYQSKLEYETFDAIFSEEECSESEFDYGHFEDFLLIHRDKTSWGIAGNL
jgi:hypothetical protein